MQQQQQSNRGDRYGRIAIMVLLALIVVTLQQRAVMNTVNSSPESQPPSVQPRQQEDRPPRKAPTAVSPKRRRVHVNDWETVLRDAPKVVHNGFLIFYDMDSTLGQGDIDELNQRKLSNVDACITACREYNTAAEPRRCWGFVLVPEGPQCFFKSLRFGGVKGEGRVSYFLPAPPTNLKDTRPAAEKKGDFVTHPDMDSTPGVGDINELRDIYNSMEDCSEACLGYNSATERRCWGFVAIETLEGGAYDCFFKSVKFSGVKATRKTSVFLPEPAMTPEPTPLVLPAEPQTAAPSVDSNAGDVATPPPTPTTAFGPLAAFTAFDGDSAPGYGDVKGGEMTVEDINDCAARCQEMNKAPNAKGRQKCYGFVTGAAGEHKMTKCWLKAVPHVPVKSPIRTSYFQPIKHFDDPAITVVYGVLGHHKYSESRLVPILSTFLRNSKSVIFFEDDEVSRDAWAAMKSKHAELFAKVDTEVQYLKEPTDSKVRSFNGAWKNLPILKRMQELYPKTTWHAMIDDDTFVIAENLKILLSTMYYDDEPRYLGVPFTTGNKNDMFLFVQGGAGILLNIAARKKLMNNYELCLGACVQWAGDIRLGCCAHNVKLPITTDMSFWSQMITQSIGRDDRQTKCHFPVSFHNMRNATWVYDFQEAMDTIRQPASCTNTSSPVFDSKFCNSTRAKADVVPMSWDAIVSFYKTVWAERYPYQETYIGNKLPYAP